MNIQLLTIKFHLAGCHSLKEKRQRLAGAKKRLGKESFIAIMESAYQDDWQTAQWSITIIADNSAQLAQRIAFTEQAVIQSMDARIVNISNDRLW